VLRLSGPAALDCVGDRFRADAPSADWRGTYRTTRGRLRLDSQRVYTPVRLYVMRAPRSYTCEDVVELHLPGSPALVEMVLDDMLADGRLRAAEPGEFTRRAFLHGRLDLSRAEAVMGVIHARSEAELLAAGARLQGGVGRRVTVLQDEIAELRALLEVALDFSDQDVDILPPEQAQARLARVEESVQAAIQGGQWRTADRGAYHVVLCGPPNAGKSSLMNRLCGAERAIVHPRPGTTRDTVSAAVEWAGVRLHLSDTAGLMAAATGPDAQAVASARRRIRSAHLLLLVLDASASWPPAVEEVADMAGRARIICVLNKQDRPGRLDTSAVHRYLPGVPVLGTSARTGEGLDALRTHLAETVHRGDLSAVQECVFNARQTRALCTARDELQQAQETVQAGMGYEFAALNLRAANEALGTVTGEVTPQDVLDRIFSTFCIGK
jgi:tRNA modification GTPase